MYKLIFGITGLILISIFISACSEDTPVTPVIPPTPIVDTTEISNISGRLPAWSVEHTLTDLIIQNNKFWIATDLKIMYLSQDTGNTFIYVSTPRILSKLFMNSDGIHGWSGSDTLMSTSDGGYTWNYANTNFTKVNDIYFLNLNTGYVLGKNLNSGKIAKTTNAGLNWTYKTLNIDSLYVYNFNAIIIPDTLNPNTIFLGTSGGIFKSTDAGGNWIRNYFSVGNPDVYRFRLRTGNQFYVCAKNGFAASYSGFDIWKVYFTNGLDYLTSISICKEGSSGWITTPNDYLYYTTNYGNNWSTKYFKRYYVGSLNDVVTVSDSVAYFVGEATMFYKYTRK